MKRRKHYRTGLLGWSRESQLWANIATAALCASVLAVLMAGVYWR